MQSVPHWAVLVLMFHNQDLRNAPHLGRRGKESNLPKSCFLSSLCSGGTVWEQDSFPQVWGGVSLPLSPGGKFQHCHFSCTDLEAGGCRPIFHCWRNKKWTTGMWPWEHCPTLALGPLSNPKVTNRSHWAPSAGHIKCSRTRMTASGGLANIV